MRTTPPDRPAHETLGCSWSRATHQGVVPALLAAAWLLAGSPAAGEEALLSARTQVVVLVGVPGDAETESTYTRQIGRLLERLAQANPSPAGVTVLVDDPGLVRAPEALGARVVLASRAELRAVASGLADDELVMFVWGHGGLKAADPVVHVRGPRIEPADLAALAEQAARSTWFLLFRQSGAFAKRLRAPSRTIVASEGDTAYGDDPIGVEILLDLLHDRPGADAETLARALGPATAAWYDRRHLARTEEPTLWPGTSEPIRLADASAEAFAPAPAPEARVTAADAWDAIAPATPEQYPGTPAVVLRRSVVQTIGAKPALESVIEEFVQILTREGERYAELAVAFSPSESFHLLDLERRNRDGTIDRLDSGLFGGAPPPAGGEELPAVQRTEALPGAEPGVIFRVRYRSEWTSFPLPHVHLEVPLAGPLPIAAMSVEVHAARDGAFHFGFRHHERTEPETSDGRYERIHRWQFARIDAVVPESLVNPSGPPALLVSTFPDWRAFSAGTAA